MQYYVVSKSIQYGPLSEKEVVEKVNDKKFSLSDSAYHEGLSDWASLGSMIAITSCLKKEFDLNIELEKEEIDFELIGMNKEEIEKVLSVDLSDTLDINVSSIAIGNDLLVKKIYLSHKICFITVLIDKTTKSFYKTVVNSDFKKFKKLLKESLLGFFDNEIFNKLMIGMINNGTEFEIEITDTWNPNKGGAYCNPKFIPKIGTKMTVTKYAGTLRLDAGTISTFIPVESYTILDIKKEAPAQVFIDMVSSEKKKEKKVYCCDNPDNHKVRKWTQYNKIGTEVTCKVCGEKWS